MDVKQISAEQFVKAWMIAYKRDQTMVDLANTLGMGRWAVFQRKKTYIDKGVKLPALRKHLPSPKESKTNSPFRGGRGCKLDIIGLNQIVEAWL